MKKLGTILLAGLLVCVVAACGLVETDTAGTETSAPESAAAEEIEPTTEPTAEPTEEPTPESTPEATEAPEETPAPEQNTALLDWDALAEDFKADTAVNQDFVRDVYVGCDGDMIQLTAVVDPSTADDVVLDYVDTMLRRLGTLAHQQNDSFTMPDKNSYGGLFDSYSVMIGVAPLGSESNQDDWYIFDSIGRLVQTNHELKITRKD